MIQFRLKVTIPALALALAACADKPVAAPNHGPAAEAKQDPADSPKPKFQKPVRMNGRGELSSISFEQFFELQQSGKALIIDARPAFFYHLGHIPGAIHLPKEDCDENIHKREAEIQAALADGKTIVVYCTGHGCPDARTVAIHLNGFGHPASVFSGGWHAWQDADMPVE